MCAPSGTTPTAPDRYFRPDVKCCSYLPTLPNFLVGGVLRDDEPAARAGARSVRERIGRRVGVSPLGLGPLPDYAVLYERAAGAFGRSKALLCPHFEPELNQCGIWRHRNAVCATYFCKLVRGSVAFRFWRSLQRTLELAEVGLAKWCVLELGVESRSLDALIQAGAWNGTPGSLSSEALDHTVSPREYALGWAPWEGREFEFYARCAELVDRLSWIDVLAVGGQDLRAAWLITQDRYRQLRDPGVPDRLAAGTVAGAEFLPDGVRLSTYSALDPLDVPHEVVAALRYFDGREIPQVMSEIKSRLGIELEASLLRKLVDFDLLKPIDTIA